MSVFLIIAGLFGYLDCILLSIRNIKKQDSLKPREIDAEETILSYSDWRMLEEAESAKRVIIFSPVLLLIIADMIFMQGMFLSINKEIHLYILISVPAIMLILAPIFIISEMNRKEKINGKS